MKKLMSIVLALVMALSLCVTTTWAAVTEVNTETDLRNAAAAGGEIKLTGNIELTSTLEIKDSKSVTIDLNGFTITSNIGTAIKVNNGYLTVTGTGNINVKYEAFRLVGNKTADHTTATPAELTIHAGVTVVSENDCCVFMYGKGAKVDVYGSLTSKGVYATIMGNGSKNATEDCGDTVITIYEGAEVIGFNGAIYHPQSGTLTVNGGKITGPLGIEMRAGTLNINGGIIEGTGDYAVDENTSGSTTKGAAVAVAEHGTKLGVTVNVRGGTIIARGAAKALSVTDPQGVSATSTNPITVNITGGSVNGEVFQPDEFEGAKPTAITGGTFNTDVTAFVPTGTPVAKDEAGSQYVGSDSIADAANSGKEMTMVQGGAIDGLAPGAVIIVPQGVTGTTLNGNAAEHGYYTIADPNAYQHEPVRRQHTTTPVEETTTTTDTKADDTTKADTVTSAKTFDAGVAVYGVMAVLSLTGSAAVIGKKKEF